MTRIPGSSSPSSVTSAYPALLPHFEPRARCDPGKTALSFSSGSSDMIGQSGLVSLSAPGRAVRLAAVIGFSRLVPRRKFRNGHGCENRPPSEIVPLRSLHAHRNLLRALLVACCLLLAARGPLPTVRIRQPQLTLPSSQPHHARTTAMS